MDGREKRFQRNARSLVAAQPCLCVCMCVHAHGQVYDRLFSRMYAGGHISYEFLKVGLSLMDLRSVVCPWITCLLSDKFVYVPLEVASFSTAQPENSYTSVALVVWEQATKMKTENKVWCNGSEDLHPLWDWGAESTLSPAFIPNCRLQDFLRSYLSQDTCCVNHKLLSVMDYTDIVQISLCLPQVVPSWASLGNNQQVHRQCSCLTLTRCSKVPAFMIPVILLSGSGLGVCNKVIILKKNMQDNH